VFSKLAVCWLFGLAGGQYACARILLEVPAAFQIRAFVSMKYTVLGTDGFGRSDTRANLRRFFEVDRYYIAHAAIAA
jgi:hypothetical protein